MAHEVHVTVYFRNILSLSSSFCFQTLTRSSLQQSTSTKGEMKPIFCGNFEYDARQSDLERLFRKYGKVDRVDMKSGFAFVYMEDERDAEDAIRRLDNLEFGRKGRRLRVEWTKQERSVRKPVSSRRSSSNSRPSKTLFVINFDPYNTRTRDLERHFDPYGKILNIRIRRNFAFIQFESQDDASKALDATNMSKLMDRVISVEFAIKDDDERRNRHSSDRIRDRSPQRRSDDRGRSPSPYRRERGSPDYGRGGRGCSPSPNRRERGSPDYGRGGPRESTIGRDRKTNCGRGSSRSPIGRERYGRGHSKSPNGRNRKTDNGRGGSSPNGRDRKSDHACGHSPSPIGRGRNSDYVHGHSPSPQRELPSPDPVRGSSPGERISPAYDDVRSPNPRADRVVKPDYGRGASLDSKPEVRDSPEGYSGGESPIVGRYRSESGSPVAWERSRS